LLKIKTLKESFRGSNYTSALLHTKDTFSLKYRRLEIRAKLALGAASWSPFCLLGSNVITAGWPACGEIDMMKHSGNDQNKISTLSSAGR